MNEPESDITKNPPRLRNTLVRLWRRLVSYFSVAKTILAIVSVGVVLGAMILLKSRVVDVDTFKRIKKCTTIDGIIDALCEVPSLSPNTCLYFTNSVNCAEAFYVSSIVARSWLQICQEDYTSVGKGLRTAITLDPSNTSASALLVINNCMATFEKASSTDVANLTESFVELDSNIAFLSTALLRDATSERTLLSLNMRYLSMNINAQLCRYQHALEICDDILYELLRVTNSIAATLRVDTQYTRAKLLSELGQHRAAIDSYSKLIDGSIPPTAGNIIDAFSSLKTIQIKTHSLDLIIRANAVVDKYLEAVAYGSFHGEIGPCRANRIAALLALGNDSNALQNARAITDLVCSNTGTMMSAHRYVLWNKASAAFWNSDYTNCSAICEEIVRTSSPSNDEFIVQAFLLKGAANRALGRDNVFREMVANAAIASRKNRVRDPYCVYFISLSTNTCSNTLYGVAFRRESSELCALFYRLGRTNPYLYTVMEQLSRELSNQRVIDTEKSVTLLHALALEDFRRMDPTTSLFHLDEAIAQGASNPSKVKATLIADLYYARAEIRTHPFIKSDSYVSLIEMNRDDILEARKWYSTANDTAGVLSCDSATSAFVRVRCVYWPFGQKRVLFTLPW